MPRMRLPLVGHLARGLVLTRPTSLPLLPFSVWHFLRIVSFVKRCCSVQVVLRMRRCVEFCLRAPGGGGELRVFLLCHLPLSTFNPLNRRVKLHGWFNSVLSEAEKDIL